MIFDDLEKQIAELPTCEIRTVVLKSGRAIVLYEVLRQGISYISGNDINGERHIFHVSDIQYLS